MSEHTEAWRIAKSGISVDAGMIRIRLESGSWEEKRAICRLIAAAPELLAACEALVAWQDKPTLKGEPPIDQLRAAIAAATGEGEEG